MVPTPAIIAGLAGNFGKIVAVTRTASSSLSGMANAANQVTNALHAQSTAMARASRNLSTFDNHILRIAERMNATSEAMRQTGAKSPEIAKLISMGIPIEQISQRAEEIHQLLTSNQAAIAFGSSIGAVARPGPFGEVDKAANLVRVLEHLRGLEGDQQTRMSRVFGQQDALSGLVVGEDVKALQQSFEALFNTVQDAGAAKAANDLSESWRLMTEMGELAVTAFGKTAFEPMKRGIMAVAHAFEALAYFFETNPQFGEEIGKLLERFLEHLAGFILELPLVWNAFASGFNDLVKRLQTIPFLGDRIPDITLPTLDVNIQGLMDAITRQVGATQENTRASQEMTRLLKEGMYGGAERARRALPAAWSGAFLRDHWTSGALRAGAFGL